MEGILRSDILGSCETIGSLESKKITINYIWPIIVGIALVVMSLGILGSCLGCEACIEACNSVGNDQCGNRIYSKGCGSKDAPAGCTCTTCNEKFQAYVLYVIVVNDNGNEIRRFQLEQEVKFDNTAKGKKIYIDSNIVTLNRSNYFDIMGYYGVDDNKLHVDENGVVKSPIQNGKQLYAKIKEKNLGGAVEVNFGTNDNMTSVLPTSASIGGLFTNIPAPECYEGYRFKGWAYNDKLISDENGIVFEQYSEFHLYTFNIHYGDVLELVPIVEEIRPTVEFTFNDNIESLQVDYATSLVEFLGPYQTLIRDHFKGWEINGTIKDPTGIIITEDINVKSIYYGSQVVNFNYQIDGVDSTQIKIFGDDGYINFDAPSETKIGFKFNCWNTLPDGNGDTYVGVSGDNENIPTNLYAIWEQEIYTITYMVDNELFLVDNFHYGDEKELLQSVDDKFGKIFTGWEILGQFYTDNLPIDLAENVRADAVFDTVNVKFNLDELQGDLNDRSAIVKFEMEGKIQCPTLNNMAFVGWFLKDYPYTQITDGDGNTLGKITLELLGLPSNPETLDLFNSGIALEAKYEKPKFNVNFYDDNNEIIYTDVVVMDNQVSNLPEKQNKDGYEFAGWVIKGTSTLFDFETNINKDYDLEPLFVPKKFTIYLMLDEINKFGEIEVEYGSIWSAEGYIPTKDGEIFIGWYNESGQKWTDKNGKVIDSNPFTYLENVYLYAHFVENI